MKKEKTKLMAEAPEEEGHYLGRKERLHSLGEKGVLLVVILSALLLLAWIFQNTLLK